jgi:hypothetical protein
MVFGLWIVLGNGGLEPRQHFGNSAEVPGYLVVPNAHIDSAVLKRYSVDVKRYRWLLVLALICIIVGVWTELYPSTSDPKNLGYVLWKHGLFPMNPDTALGTMIGDARRESLVIGKSREALTRKFGYLTPPREASMYYRSYWQRGPYRQTDAAFLRASPWMVVFDHGRASNLVLVKGW